MNKIIVVIAIVFAFTLVTIFSVDLATAQTSDPTTPVLVSVELISGVYHLSWNLPETTLVAPDGGYDIFIDGFDTNDEHRTTSLQTQIGGLDTSVTHCFEIQARWTQVGDTPVSNEICVPTDDPEPSFDPSELQSQIDSNDVELADHETRITDLQEQIDAIPAGSQGETDDLPVEFIMITTLTGMITPQGDRIGILFFGDTLCIIEGGSSFLIKFGGQTTVDHDTNTCNKFSNNHAILLEGNSDAVFQKGDILALQQSNGFYHEVYREQTP